MSSRWIEFFEADQGPLSMTRLLCFMSFFPATYVLLNNQGENYLGWYLGAFVGGYIGGKASDAMGKSKPSPVNVENIEEVSVKETPKPRGQHDVAIRKR